MRTPHDALIATLAGTVGRFRYVSLERAEAQGLVAASRLPLTLKILVEGALRHAEDPACLDLAALADRPRRGTLEFQPARLLLQDFTGIPLMTDMASLRDEIARRGGDPAKANPRIPIDFVCDHALIAVHGGRPDAQALNEEIEIARNRERFEFLKWCAEAFASIRLIPPGSGIMHQLNLEWLSTVVFLEQAAGMTLARPDTLLGTDSHTPMVGGLGVLGWGVGGIEAQAAMLGHRVKTSLAPGSRVVGDYLAAAGLQRDLDALGFHIIGYGCTTCNGNSGPLADEIARDITENDIAAVAVLSGNRNFAGRIHPLVPASYLASPALVVAYAIAGTVLTGLSQQPLGNGADGRPVMLADIWPSDAEITSLLSWPASAVRTRC
jgi:aconitase A